MDFLRIFAFCFDTIRRIKGIWIFPIFSHKEAVKFNFQKAVGNSALIIHFIDKRMTGRVQKIMTAKAKKIGKKRLITSLSDLRHSLGEKCPGFFFVHTVSYTAYVILKNKIIEENIRSVKTDPIQFTVFPYNFFHLIGQLPVYFLTKQIMCICCGHFFSPVLSPAVYLRLTCPVSLSAVYPRLTYPVSLSAVYPQLTCPVISSAVYP